jgi:hypothetical protein
MNMASTGQEESPEQITLRWLSELPPMVCHILVMRFVLMTSQDSGDFALSGQESCEHFARYLGEPDFALRRLARILIVRTVFNFILEQEDEFFSACSAESSDVNLPSFDAAQILRAQKSWRDLCRHRLSNEQLVVWLHAQPD